MLSRWRNTPVLDNSPSKVAFRQAIQELDGRLRSAIAAGHMVSTESQWDNQHCFAPVDREYGRNLHLYGRTIFIPKDSWMIGKIHRYPCINFVLKGKIAVGYDAKGGNLEAPAMFVSDAGAQKVGYALEDTIWATAHITHGSSVDRIEDELTVETYAELGLIDHIDRLQIGAGR